MKVIAKMQALDNDPVDMPWGNELDAVGVMLSVAQLLEHAKDEAPFSPEVISITIEL